MKAVTLGELVEFVLKCRRGKAFAGYTEPEIANMIIDKAQKESLLYACNKDDKVCGIILATIYPDAKIVFVDDVLTTERWAFKSFVRLFKERFNDFRLVAQRWKGPQRANPITICYNTDKLTKRILTT